MNMDTFEYFFLQNKQTATTTKQNTHTVKPWVESDPAIGNNHCWGYEQFWCFTCQLIFLYFCKQNVIQNVILLQKIAPSQLPQLSSQSTVSFNMAPTWVSYFEVNILVLVKQLPIKSAWEESSYSLQAVS